MTLDRFTAGSLEAGFGWVWKITCRNRELKGGSMGYYGPDEDEAPEDEGSE